MDIVPKNEFISLDTLEKYIERYPEDTEKWLEFVKDPAEDILERRKRTSYPNIDINEEIYKIYEELHNIEAQKPIEHFTDGCLFCKKSWIATDGVPTITLICGHKFHTVCSMIDQYNGDVTRCIVPDCDIDTWDYVRKIVRSKEKVKSKCENILLQSIEKRKDFKDDLKDLKQHVANVSAKHSLVRTMISNGKKEFIHNNLYSLNQIQNDINESVKIVKESEQMHNYKKSVAEYRKKASYIFRKYHVSFRDLNLRGLLTASWRLRWILERHRNPFSYYRMGFRMQPGKKLWKDTVPESDSEDEIVLPEENEII